MLSHIKKKKKSKMKNFGMFFKRIIKEMFPRIKPRLYFSFSKAFIDKPQYYLDEIEKQNLCPIQKEQLTIAFQLSLNTYSSEREFEQQEDVGPILTEQHTSIVS
jgi:hypothetical protein